MEIDFLGLNSPKYVDVERQSCKNSFTDSGNGGVETSLSLSTSSSLDSQRDILNFCESGNPAGTLRTLNASKTEQHSLILVSTPVFRPSPTTTTAGFLYDLNDNSTSLRNISELPVEPASLTMLYAGCPSTTVFNDALSEKADGTMYMVGNTSTRLADSARICTRKTGYTPTVAMARRATLARFLEKRLHRMNQARTSHQLMGKSLNAAYSEVFNQAITRSNKKKNKSQITL
ncbi:uncharacterized protein LOC105167721 isoform X2 [Sesamum indicum]|uniref:Uncharacterized protein LOC105167721 isoform X2 n=1 Tax=Sesamum indicum TaxID=4182 RepID=A0A6I9TWR8_SESIN|nr:uncharacterized protein LOC105167721 isoform X2 [Sesamum indicum]